MPTAFDAIAAMLDEMILDHVGKFKIPMRIEIKNTPHTRRTSCTLPGQGFQGSVLTNHPWEVACSMYNMFIYDATSMFPPIDVARPRSPSFGTAVRSTSTQVTTTS